MSAWSHRELRMARIAADGLRDSRAKQSGGLCVRLTSIRSAASLSVLKRGESDQWSASPRDPRPAIRSGRWNGDGTATRNARRTVVGETAAVAVGWQCGGRDGSRVGAKCASRWGEAAADGHGDAAQHSERKPFPIAGRLQHSFVARPQIGPTVAAHSKDAVSKAQSTRVSDNSLKCNQIDCKQRPGLGAARGTRTMLELNGEG